MQMYRIVALTLLLSSAVAHADCAAQSSAMRPHLIELYSSEGCSSCPPAERWLRGLHNGSDVVALEFHVDYWDRLGWRDRFDDARYTSRQELIAARDGGSSVYTPQVVLDGRSWAGWYRAGSLAPASPGHASMRVNVESGSPLHVRVDTVFNLAARANSAANGASHDAAWRNYVALLEDGLVSDVRAGENSGVTLRHDHVVRAFAGPLALAGARFDLAVADDVDLSHASLVAFAQNTIDGEVAQVVSLSLAQCR